MGGCISVDVRALSAKIERPFSSLQGSLGRATFLAMFFFKREV